MNKFESKCCCSRAGTAEKRLAFRGTKRESRAVFRCYAYIREAYNHIASSLIGEGSGRGEHRLLKQS